MCWFLRIQINWHLTVARQCVWVQNLSICSRFHSRSWLQVDQQYCTAQIQYCCTVQHPSLPLQENWEVHPIHRSILYRNMASGVPHVSPPWPGFHEIITKRNQTPMSHLIVYSYRPNSKRYQRHFCHGREKSVQANSSPPFGLGLSCWRVFLLSDLAVLGLISLLHCHLRDNTALKVSVCHV